MATRLDTLLLHALPGHCLVWRADAQARSGQRAEGRAIASGCAQLDALLPAGGWPIPALIEVLYEQQGIGELKLFVPALARLGKPYSAGIARALAWINPPCVPYAPALQAWGLDPARQLIATSLAPAQMLWTMEQALRSRACSAVLGWNGRIELRWLRRLKLAAIEGGCLGIVFRPLRYRTQPSPATVRLALAADPRISGAMQVQLLKIQGGRPGILQWQ